MQCAASSTGELRCGPDEDVSTVSAGARQLEGIMVNRKENQMSLSRGQWKTGNNLLMRSAQKYPQMSMVLISGNDA